MGLGCHIMSKDSLVNLVKQILMGKSTRYQLGTHLLFILFLSILKFNLILQKEKKKKTIPSSNLVKGVLVPVWIPLNVVSTFCVFKLFFFFLRVNSNITWFYCAMDKKYYSYIVHGSHDTIHTYKNYFVTVFSVSVIINSIQTDS